VDVPVDAGRDNVMLMTPDDVEQWLRGSTVEDTLKMQKPAPDDAIVIRPGQKKAA